MNNAINAFNSYRVDGNNEVMIDNFDLNRYSKYLNDSLKEYDLRAQVKPRSLIMEMCLHKNKIMEGLPILMPMVRCNGNVYHIGWSRILYQPEDIVMLKDIFKTRSCNHETN